MVTAGVAALWSAFVLTSAVVLRPRRAARVAALRLGRVRPAAAPRPTTGLRGRLPSLALMVSVAMGALAVSPIAAAPAVGAVLLARRAAAGRAERRRRHAVVGELPDVIALLALALGAGMTVTRAVAAVGQRGWGLLAGELRAVADEVANGRRLADCLEELPGRVGEGVRPLTTALLSSERYGTPILESLDRLAAETRADARRRADEAARRAPVKLAFPLVVCILPAFALLTVAPLLASALRGLRL